MREITRIHDQLIRAFDGEAWSGPSLLATLPRLTASQAAARPVVQGHTIWEIVLHLAVWIDTVRQRLETGRVLSLMPEQDWPAQPTEYDDERWQAALQHLRRAHQQLLSVVAEIRDEELDDEIGQEPGAGYSVYVLLHGLAQHNLYHAGQISLLRKALGL